VNFKGGEAAIATAGSGPPVMTVYQSLDDFRAAAGAIGGGLGFGGPGGQGDLTKTRVSRLKTLKGTMQFKVTDLPDGREMPVTLQFGEGERAEPQTVIAIKADDARKMRTGELNPQMAFMQGMIRITGDAALAMQVGMAMM
jgi:SCP-2 sterol transfer family protein